MNLKKLTNVIAKLQVGKNHKNDFGKYNYRNAEDILQGLKPLTYEYGILVTISDSIELVGDRYYVKATVKVFDTEDGALLAENAAYAREALNKKGMDDAQVTGSASSYARKYALGGMFNLAVAADPDEIEPEKQEKPKPAVTHHTATKLAEMLARASLDANDFSQLLYNGTPFEKLTQENIDYCVMNFQYAVDEYHRRDAKRPMGA